MTQRQQRKRDSGSLAGGITIIFDAEGAKETGFLELGGKDRGRRRRRRRRRRTSHKKSNNPHIRGWGKNKKRKNIEKHKQKTKKWKLTKNVDLRGATQKRILQLYH